MTTKQAGSFRLQLRVVIVANIWHHNQKNIGLIIFSVNFTPDMGKSLECSNVTKYTKDNKKPP